MSSLFVPGIAAGKALGLLNKLGCWLAKQTNATSLALSGLLTDVDSIRYATLQNRAAIDFLLLAHGHGCEEFDGVCCMNLSEHSKLVFAALGAVLASSVSWHLACLCLPRAELDGDQSWHGGDRQISVWGSPRPRWLSRSKEARRSGGEVRGGKGVY